MPLNFTLSATINFAVVVVSVTVNDLLIVTFPEAPSIDNLSTLFVIILIVLAFKDPNFSFPAKTSPDLDHLSREAESVINLCHMPDFLMYNPLPAAAGE